MTVEVHLLSLDSIFKYKPKSVVELWHYADVGDAYLVAYTELAS